MNSNELMKDLYKVITESGWLDRANEFYHNHPEYFHETKHGGFISQLSMSVSYQPASLSAVSDVKESVFFYMGGSITDFAREYIVFNTGHTVSRVWMNGDEVTEVRDV